LNRTLITIARALLLGAKLLLKFWQEAVDTVCYIQNKTPVGPKKKTPEKAYTGKVLYIGYLRAWGCLAYTRVPKDTRDSKLHPTGIQYIFVGYKTSTKQYRLYKPRRKVIIETIEPMFKENNILK
jgi:hypothetical protein